MAEETSAPHHALALGIRARCPLPCHHDRMSDTAEIRDPGRRAPSRTPAAIRAALSGNEKEEFEYRYRLAVERAASDYDLTQLNDVLDEWWRIAVLTSDPVAHQHMLETAALVRAGQRIPGMASWDSVRGALGA